MMGLNTCLPKAPWLSISLRSLLLPYSETHRYRPHHSTDIPSALSGRSRRIVSDTARWGFHGTGRGKYARSLHIPTIAPYRSPGRGMMPQPAGGGKKAASRALWRTHLRRHDQWLNWSFSDEEDPHDKDHDDRHVQADIHQVLIKLAFGHIDLV